MKKTWILTYRNNQRDQLIKVVQRCAAVVIFSIIKGNLVMGSKPIVMEVNLGGNRVFGKSED